MANTLKIKRGLAASIPQGQLAEPLFTTDTYDLYIGKGAGGNQRIQNYIASGTSSQFLKGDGSLDSTTYQATSEKGQNNGYASLDAGGKIPAAQLPSSVIEYKGTWNASTNTPTLADGTGDAGDVYIVSVGGTQNLGSGNITFDAGDWVMYNGSVWQKSTGSNAVASVNGQTGVVTITFDQLSPMTTLGDLIYGAASGAGTRLAGNITSTKKFLSQTGTGTASAAPSWETVTKTDVGLSNVENTALSTWAGSSNIVTLGTITSGTWNGTTIAIANGGTGQTTKADAFNALSPMTTLGDIIFGGTTGNGNRLAGNTTTTKKFLVQTGTGTDSASPLWGTIAAGDVPALAYLSDSSSSTQDGYFGNIYLYDDSTPSHYLGITNSANLTAARTLSINVNDANRTISLEGNLTVSANSTISGTNSGDQTITLTGDVTGSGTGSFATTIGALKVTNAMLAGSIDYAKMDGTTVPTWNQNTTGNAATATKLATARTLTIGATGKTFDGSANVSWSLAEIGAEPTLTKGNLTETTSSVLTITGGTGAVIGSGTTIAVASAGAAQNGVVTTGAQTLAGAKTLTDLLTGTRVAMTASVTSGAANSFAVTQTQRNGTDTGDIALSLSHTITASSASNQLVIRAMSFGTNNNLTGGGAVTNYRGWNVASSTQTGTTTTHLDQIYIERGTADGTVTNNRAIRINNMQGTNRAAFFVLDIGDGGTNNSYMVLGSDASATIPTGNWGIYQIQSTYNNYFNGKVLIKTTTDAGYALDVNGTARLSGALTGTSATFSGNFYVTGGTNTNIGNGIHGYYESNYAQIQLNGATNGGALIDFSTSGTDYKGRIIYDNTSNSLGFIAGGSASNNLTISSTGAATFSGGVGVATSPYGWATLKGLDVGSNAGLGSYDSYYTMLTNNTYYNGTDFKYKVNGYAGWLQFRSDDGTVYLATTSASGTAGTSVTGMTTRLSFSSTGAATFSNNVNISTGGASFQWTNSGNNVAIFADSGYLRFDTGTTGYTERMRINSSGDLLLKGRSTTANFDAVFYNDNSQLAINATNTTTTKAINFNVSSTVNAMSITSGGEVLINTGTDSGAYYLQVNGSVYATAYYESSDIRLKDVLTNSYSENFSAIEFMWKDKRDEKKHWGYAAQDVMKYIPDAIEVNNDGMMTVNYNEAHTWKIAQLEAKILELEAKLK